MLEEARRLAAHADFRTEDEGGLSWWGRELTGVERAGALAQIQSLVGDEPIEEAGGSQRWLCGRLELREYGFEVSVNSDERLHALMACSASWGRSLRSGDSP